MSLIAALLIAQAPLGLQLQAPQPPPAIKVSKNEDEELKPATLIQNKFMPTAFGGQFKDLLLPIPIIHRLTSEGIWGHPNVLPRDIENGMESND